MDRRGASAHSGGPAPARRGEGEAMRGLNERLAGFMRKVHELEQHNHLLQREIQQVRETQGAAHRLQEEQGAEVGRLRKTLQDISLQKHQVDIERLHLEEERCGLRRRHEEDARGRSEAQSKVSVLRKDVEDANRAKALLDRKAQSLVDEIHFLRRQHEDEVSNMIGRIRDQRVNVGAREFGDPGVTAALRDIRAQLEGRTLTGALQLGTTFQSEFARLTEAAESRREALRAAQQEARGLRRSLQTRDTERDCAQGTREALERQLHDAEGRHKEEIIHYQNTIKELENELINCKFDMSGYLREYQDLLHVKMALDQEILSYRKLLCGEEARLPRMPDSHITLPYVYHQSPVYTLPRLCRPGGPRRRAEPQYKFVEEIITETTREIEMSEFEDTGSEETDAWKDEWKCYRRDRGDSEEEKIEEDGRGEESEQSHVASGGNSANAGDDRE